MNTEKPPEGEGHVTMKAGQEKVSGCQKLLENSVAA